MNDDSLSKVLCDCESLQTFVGLVEGPLRANTLPAVERFVRSFVLHDETILKPKCTASVLEGSILQIAQRSPELNTYGLIETLPADVKLFHKGQTDSAEEDDFGVWIYNAIQEFPPAMGEEAATLLLGKAYAAGVESGFSTRYRESGASLLTITPEFNEFDQEPLPNSLFATLDAEWHEHAKKIETSGLKFSVPPVLSIVLSRSANRTAIPRVLSDLRDEWFNARRKVWRMLRDLRECATLSEAIEIEHELKQASLLFSPKKSDFDTRPIRVLWDVTSGAAAGAAIAALSGGKPLVGAITGGIAQAARSAPPLGHEFGRALFGLGAFDLARRVRREVSKIERTAIQRLVSDKERKQLLLG
jgi:hypothetical protein